MGQVSEPTTTTSNSGIIIEFTSGSVIGVKESNGSMRYCFGKTMTYVTNSGTVLDEDTARTKIKVGVPVHFKGTEEDRMADRVTLEDEHEDRN